MLSSHDAMPCGRLRVVGTRACCCPAAVLAYLTTPPFASCFNGRVIVKDSRASSREGGMDAIWSFMGLSCCRQVREPKGRSFRYAGESDDAGEQAGSAPGPTVTYAGGEPTAAKAFESSRPMAGVGVVFLCTADGALAVRRRCPVHPPLLP